MSYTQQFSLHLIHPHSALISICILLLPCFEVVQLHHTFYGPIAYGGLER